MNGRLKPQIAFRATPELERQLQQAAAREHSHVSAVVRRLVSEGLRREAAKDARLTVKRTS